MVRTKTRDEMKSRCSRASKPSHIRSASVAGEIAKHIHDWRNNIHRWVGGGLDARTGSVASICDSVRTLDGVHRDVLVDVDHIDGQADTVGYVVQTANRINPADV